MAKAKKEQHVGNVQENPYAEFDLTKADGSPAVILQIIPNLNMGGAERSCVDVASAIRDAGGIPIVVSNGGVWASEIARRGGEHIHLPVHSKNPFTIHKNAKRLAEIIQQYDVDIVHARSRAPGWVAYKACQMTGIPYMTTFHAAYKFKTELKRRYNSVMAKGERIIAISKFIANHIVDNYGADPKVISIAYRGIALEKFHPSNVNAERRINMVKKLDLPDDRPIILLPSRLTRIKGPNVLIEALALLKNKEVHCAIFGAKPENSQYQEELSDLAKKVGVEGMIRMHGPCDDMPAAYSLASVAIAASIVPEGFGRMAAESQAMGCPTIATDIGAVPEVVLDGKTGWLVPPDDPVALAAAIDEALSMTEKQHAKLATAAMNHVANSFSLENMCAVVLDAYEDLLKEKQAKNKKRSVKKTAKKKTR